MNIGEAIEKLKAGERVARAGWNGKGMWLLHVPAADWGTSVGHEDTSTARRLPWIGMKIADGGFVPWLASQTDLLAEDWEVVQ